MNLQGIRFLESHGYTFVRAEKRGTQYVAIATKPRPEGGEWKAEAGGATIHEAEMRLVQVVIRK